MQAVPLGNYRCETTGSLIGVVKFIPTFMEECADIYMTQYGDYVHPTDDGMGFFNSDGISLVQLDTVTRPALAHS